MDAFPTESDQNGGPSGAGPRGQADLVARGFRLAGWSVHPTLNRLSRDGVAVRLEPKIMDVLVELARRAGRVVPKEHLIHTLWGREYLAESVLTRAVAELRRVLEDDAHAPRFIETIPKRGYRLIAQVTPLPVTEPPLRGGGPRHAGGWLAAAAFAVGASIGWLAVRLGRRRKSPR